MSRRGSSTLGVFTRRPRPISPTWTVREDQSDPPTSTPFRLSYPPDHKTRKLRFDRGPESKGTYVPTSSSRCEGREEIRGLVWGKNVNEVEEVGAQSGRKTQSGKRQGADRLGSRGPPSPNRPFRHKNRLPSPVSTTVPSQPVSRRPNRRRGRGWGREDVRLRRSRREFGGWEGARVAWGRGWSRPV